MASIDINYSRQMDVFVPSEFRKSVDVIGAGAVGSHVVFLLAKMGVSSMRVIDFDTVGDHNVPNQMYTPVDVGALKVHALAKTVKAMAGVDIRAENMAVEPGCGYKPSQIVFLMVDSMTVRKNIVDSFLRGNPGVDLVIDARMGSSSGRVYAWKPFDPDHSAGWDRTWYPDDKAEVSLCGTSIAVIPTVMSLASLAVWQMVSFLKGKRIDNEIVFDLNPFTVVGQNRF